MTREEAKELFEDNFTVINTHGHYTKEEEGQAQELAISALSKNKGEDRPQGHWIEKGYVGDGKYLFECSECHSTDTQSKTAKVNYCWNCGADMKGGKE